MSVFAGKGVLWLLRPARRAGGRPLDHLTVKLTDELLRGGEGKTLGWKRRVDLISILLTYLGTHTFSQRQ